MRRFFIAFLAMAASLAQAQTLRWAAQGDMQTADPHAANEIQTNSLNGQVYEYLGRRMPDQSVGPALATEWTQVLSLIHI